MSLSKDADPSCNSGRVVDSFTSLDETRTRRMFDINKDQTLLLLRVLCIAILLLSLDTPPLSLGDHPRGWGGGCLQMRRTQRFLFVSLPCNQKDFRVQNFLKLK